MFDNWKEVGRSAPTWKMASKSSADNYQLYFLIVKVYIIITQIDSTYYIFWSEEKTTSPIISLLTSPIFKIMIKTNSVPARGSLPWGGGLAWKRTHKSGSWTSSPTVGKPIAMRMMVMVLVALPTPDQNMQSWSRWGWSKKHEWWLKRTEK